MRDHENDYEQEEVSTPLITEPNKKTKPHVVRRNIEDYLEKQALQRRLKDIFDEDFLLD
ncbi:PA3496 family putative envelope integrity protein [uncultured Thiothrix sp.]|jgi:hypothetical protein|uniref:PA3496 family putative envelope integrity protein n=1 Tax=uncultured Thiothrix sp. TaxID=223185 RepID=UPI002625DEB9|nr:hypothetical protein [uncultured Thiothrix sp.]HMT94138.1 hypothetical protein [Thiolinea sp.]